TSAPFCPLTLKAGGPGAGFQPKLHTKWCPGTPRRAGFGALCLLSRQTIEGVVHIGKNSATPLRDLSHSDIQITLSMIADDGINPSKAYFWVWECDKLHADDTPVPVLAPGTGKTKTGRLWTYVRDDRASGSTDPPAVWFAYSPAPLRPSSKRTCLACSL